MIYSTLHTERLIEDKKHDLIYVLQTEICNKLSLNLSEESKFESNFWITFKEIDILLHIL